ncbi:MAG: PilZ domain-containing protein [Methylobacteriaceae bacterium]|nr:PilZ domain-containing protein [Methylobacteriaceae bacterium]MBV9246931.1 PilZ domain-containing protein [Methylobacteriaceae bacterium]MBV9635887.1 PilZ domain-containing protein [Methylobacteriaceae bacterium]MBV9705009.1 PilZ domain-containing protein [Methylobacteriaceae bacterium]
MSVIIEFETRRRLFLAGLNGHEAPATGHAGQLLPASQGVERRTTPRIYTERRAELAIGTMVVPICVVDVSIGGCGIELLDGDFASPLPGEAAVGILNLQLLKSNSGTRLLPVVLRNFRSGRARLGLGFQFPSLDHAQRRALCDFIDDVQT